MPRGRCHFALLYFLHERLREELPDTAGLADRHFPDFLAGSVGPDALRALGRMGKRATHFYEEGDRATWGKAISGMFEAHPDLADPDALEAADQALLIGYISHLTVDEAFRDVVTSHVHGIDNWRPIIMGLWSRVDEIPIGYGDLIPAIDRFVRTDRIGFIDCQVVKAFLDRTRPWAQETDPWLIEKVFLDMIESDLPDDQAKKEMNQNRTQAGRFLGPERERLFIEAAVGAGTEAVRKFVSSAYRKAGSV